MFCASYCKTRVNQICRELPVILTKFYGAKRGRENNNFDSVIPAKNEIIWGWEGRNINVNGLQN